MSRANVEEIYKLSPMQEGMLFHSVEDDGSGAYFQQVSCRLVGPLDEAAFERAWQQVVDRHPALRTAFFWKEAKNPLQVVYRRVPIRLTSEDWRDLPERVQEARLEERLRDDRDRGFDLGKAPLLRLLAIRLGGRRHHFLWSYHHLLLDGWSLPVVLREVFTLYGGLRKGRRVDLERPRPYRDYIAWLEAREPAAAEDAWRAALRGYPPTRLDAPVDAPRPGVGRANLELGAENSEGLSELARRWRVTPATVFQGLWAVLLGRYTGSSRVVFGSTVSGRPGDLRGVERMVGLFINTLPVPVSLPPDAALGPWLAGLQELQGRLRRHQETPLSRIHGWSEAPRGEPLFDNLLVFENYPVDAVASAEPGDLRIESVRSLDVTSYPFTLLVNQGRGFRLELIHRRDRLDVVGARRFLGHLQALACHLLRTAPETPLGALDLLSSAERHQLLVEWGQPRGERPREAPLHHLVEARARLHPDAVAVDHRGRLLSYGELDARATVLASRLRGMGVGPEVLVGVVLERDLDLPMALLAVLKAGGAYVPLDPAYPRQRLELILADTAAPVVISRGRLAAGLPRGDFRVLDLDAGKAASAADGCAGAVTVTSRHLAYVIYTSGSSGRPKGVAIEHGGARALVAWAQGAYREEELARAVAGTSICFDLSVFELFVPLAAGSTVVLAEHALELPHLPARDRASMINTVPSAMAELVRQNAVPASVRVVNLAGEPLRRALVDQIHAANQEVRVLNLYGPSEDTTYSTVATARRHDAGEPTIGRPVSGTRTHVVDDLLRPVPLGAVGEILLGGAGLARGYLHRPRRTAEAFVPDPWGRRAGQRLYRTGDQARRRGDGELVFLGRRDHQVKLRGFRIELGEIEAALLRLPAVRDVAVTVRRESDSFRESQRLVAYVVLQEAAEDGVQTLRDHLRDSLPSHMVPHAWVRLPALPLTPSGKVDRRALPAPGRTFSEELEPPRTAAEIELARLWSQVLGVEEPGIHDDFFDLGGDSILSIQIAGRAQKAGWHLTPGQIFEHPTIAALARVAAAARKRTHAEQGPVVGELSPTAVQRWFLEQEIAEAHHWNQAVLLEVRRPLTPALVDRAFRHLLEHHDALRQRFARRQGTWRAWIEPPDGPSPVLHLDLSALPPVHRGAGIEAAAARLQGNLDLTRGPLVRVARFVLGTGQPERWLVAVHHLVVDGVSWRILLEDLDSLCDRLERGESPRLPAKTTSFRTWAAWVAEHAQGPLAGRTVLATDPDQLAAAGRLRRTAAPEATRIPDTVGSSRSRTVELDARETGALLRDVPRAYRARPDEALLSALARAFRRQTEGPLWVELEAHGREERLFEDADLSRTVGWFTALHPVLLDVDSHGAPEEALKAVKETLRTVPHLGLGYGLVRYLGRPEDAERLTSLPRPEVLFNYLGQLDQVLPDGSRFAPGAESTGPSRSPRGALSHPLAIDARVAGGRLQVRWTYGPSLDEEQVADLAHDFLHRLRELVAHCRRPGALGYTPSDFPLATLEQAWLDRLAAERGRIDDVYPLTPMQEGMLFHSLSDPRSAIYFEQLSWRLDGELDAAVFRRTWSVVLARHPLLRTAFLWEGRDEPVQVVHHALATPLAEIDLRRLDHGARTGVLATLLASDRRRGFEFSRAPLLRLTLVRLEDDARQAVLSYHHALMDGWSLPVLLGEAFTIYEALRAGRRPSLAPAVPFRDYVAWLETQDLDEARSHWRELLAGFTEPTPLQVDRRRSEPLEALRIYDEERLQMASHDTEDLGAWARHHRLTLNSVVQGAWALLLSRYSGRDDVVYGTTVSGRPPELPGIESMVGLFINTLPVRARSEPGEPLVPWLRDLQGQLATQRRYEYTPLPRVRNWSEVPAQSPLFESILVFENYPLDESLPEAAQALRVRDVRSFHRASYPLTAVVIPGSRLTFRLSYDRRLFDPATARRLLGHLRSLLGSIAPRSEPRLADLDLLTDAERHQVTLEWSATAPPREAPDTVISLFRRQVATRPDALAAVSGNSHLSYSRLALEARRLAERLRALGVAPEVPVGLCCERSLEFVVGILAIVEAGGFFVPLDPAYPPDRLRSMVEGARMSVLLRGPAAPGATLDDAVEHVVELARAPAPLASPAGDAEPVAGPLPGSALYAIFTSGSTGRPKGVLVEHRHLWSHLRGILERLDLPPEPAVPTVSTISADVGHTPIFGALCFGGTLHVISEEPARDPESLSAYIAERRLDFLKIVPSHLNALRRAKSGRFHLPAWRMLNGGETFFWRDAEELQAMAPTLRIFNHYGPTETTVGVMTYRLDVADRSTLGLSKSWLPLGRPLRGARIHVVDGRGRRLPVGIPGEVAIGGASVSRGYLHRPRETAERFVPDRFGGAPGGRLYRSGDLACLLADGQVEFLGRTDYQVKVRGFRVELEEVQGALRHAPGVEAAAVVARRLPGGEARLVAYVVASETPAPSPADLREALRLRLPEHMVPADFVPLDALPLNPNGKVDRARLPDPDRAPAREAEAVAPRNADEALLAGIWSDVLGVETLGVEDDYFDLGGNSLTAIRILSRIREGFGVAISPGTLFSEPTVAALARQIANARDGRPDEAAVPLDLAAEVVLDDAIRPGDAEPLRPDRVTDPRAVLLTGATGFVGAHLLTELLERTRSRVYCLVRGDDATHAMERLSGALGGFGLRLPSEPGRVVALPGDLSRPRLGLPAGRFRQLAGDLDAIIHNGALVNFAYSYPALKGPNVSGTEEILRLGALGRVKPVHFISTVSVFDSAAFRDRERVDESVDPGDSRDLPVGYVQSKWVAERLVKLAAARGLPASIFRLGRVSWHSRTGAWAETDFVHRMMLSCMQLEGAPRLDRSVTLTPVDYVARSVVALARRSDLLGGTFHLTNRRPVPWERIVAWIESRGFPLRSMNFEEWQRALLASIRTSTDNALYPLAALSGVDRSREQTERQVEQLERRSALVADDATRRALAEEGIAFPDLDDAVVDAYFRARHRPPVPAEPRVRRAAAAGGGRTGA